MNLKILCSGSTSVLPQLSGQVRELRARIVNVIEPLTMSIVLQVELEQEEQTASALRMVLKVYDR